MKSKQANIFLYLIALIVNILSFTNGIAIIFVTPILPKLESQKFIADNPFGRLLTSSELSWLAALLPLGAAIGPLLSSKVADKIGRKGALLVVASLHVMSLLLTTFAKSLPLYYTARVLIGVAAGSGFTIIPMFLAEISENHNRGIFGCSMSIFLAFGLNFALIIGPYLPIQTYSFICLCFPLIFLPVFFILCPETPVYLAAIKDEKRLASSLRKVRNKTPDEINLEVIRMLEASDNSENSGSVQDLFKLNYLRKGLIISVIVVILPQAVGIGPILVYMQFIFESANVHLAPEVCVIIVGAFQVIGAILSSISIDRVGRRVLLLSSCVCVSITLFIFGLYFYLKDRKFNVDGVSWLPLLSLVVFIVTYNIGVGSVCWVVMSELFPPNVASIAGAISSCCCFLLSFIVVLTYPSVSLYLGVDCCFFIFAIICVAGGFFIYFVLPESKGKSFQEIIRLLGYEEQNESCKEMSLDKIT